MQDFHNPELISRVSYNFKRYNEETRETSSTMQHKVLSQRHIFKSESSQSQRPWSWRPEAIRESRVESRVYPTRLKPSCGPTTTPVTAAASHWHRRCWCWLPLQRIFPRWTSSGSAAAVQPLANGNRLGKRIEEMLGWREVESKEHGAACTGRG